MKMFRIFALALFIPLLIAGAAAHAQEAQTVADPGRQPPTIDISATPDPREFLIFFLHLAQLDAAADRGEAEGNPNASAWRSFDQRTAGLTGEQGAIFKEVAYACNQALGDHDAAVQAAAAPPAEGSTGRMDIVRAALEELRSRLGEEVFQTLASYVHAVFGRNLQVVSGSPATATTGALTGSDFSQRRHVPGGNTYQPGPLREHQPAPGDSPAG